MIVASRVGALPRHRTQLKAADFHQRWSTTWLARGVDLQYLRDLPPRPHQQHMPVSRRAGSEVAPSTPQRLAHEVLSEYYKHYNAGNIDAISDLISEDVVYWDTIYSKPFYGRQELLTYLAKVRTILPSDLRFVIEDATEGDARRVGVLWHVECGTDTVLPFSHGCSFYQLNERGQISSARDVVEPSTKPGALALRILAVITPLVRALGPAADPARLPLAAAATWLLYAGYLAYVMLSSAAPGLPAYQTPPDVFLELLYQSLNFFYVNIGLHAIGVTLVPNIATPPVSEALFNFVAAWGLMFLPVLLSDGPSRKIQHKERWFVGIMFLTNVFMLPYMAVRAAPEPGAAQSFARTQGTAAQGAPVPPAQPVVAVTEKPPSWAPFVGALSLGVGLFSVYWALLGRPEYGDLAARVEYFNASFSSNRVFFAFVLDLAFYGLWQALLLNGQPAKYRFIPFFGLAAYCLARPAPQSLDRKRV